MSKAAIRNTIEEQLNSEAPDIRWLRCLFESMDDGQRSRLESVFENDRSRSFNRWMTIADWYARRKNRRRLIAAVRNAGLFLRLENCAGCFDRLLALIQSQDIPSSDSNRIDTVQLQQLGIPELLFDSSPAGEEIVNPGDMAAFHFVDSESHVQVVALSASPDTLFNRLWRITLARAGEGKGFIRFERHYPDLNFQKSEVLDGRDFEFSTELLDDGRIRVQIHVNQPSTSESR